MSNNITHIYPLPWFTDIKLFDHNCHRQHWKHRPSLDRTRSKRTIYLVTAGERMNFKSPEY